MSSWSRRVSQISELHERDQDDVTSDARRIQKAQQHRIDDVAAAEVMRREEPRASEISAVSQVNRKRPRKVISLPQHPPIPELQLPSDTIAEADESLFHGIADVTQVPSAMYPETLSLFEASVQEGEPVSLETMLRVVEGTSGVRVDSETEEIAVLLAMTREVSGIQEDLRQQMIRTGSITNRKEFTRKEADAVARSPILPDERPCRRWESLTCSVLKSIVFANNPTQRFPIMALPSGYCIFCERDISTTHLLNVKATLCTHKQRDNAPINVTTICDNPSDYCIEDMISALPEGSGVMIPFLVNRYRIEMRPVLLNAETTMVPHLICTLPAPQRMTTQNF